MIYKALISRNNRLQLVSDVNLRDNCHVYGIWGFLETLLLPDFSLFTSKEAVDWCQKNGKLELINTNDDVKWDVLGERNAP